VDGQYPFAAVLGCIDSRVPVEMVFDQGFGDIFTVRVAGNIVNPDVLGSLEFACAVAGAKAIVVMGHTSCGAVAGAIQGIRLGHLTELVGKIRPAVDEVRAEIVAAGGDASPQSTGAEDSVFANRVEEAHVRHMVTAIRERSSVLAKMEERGEIAIVGTMYDLATREVRFL